MSDAYEKNLVSQLRAKGRGWQSVSEATGRSIDYLRGAYDLSYAAHHKTPPPSKLAAVEPSAPARPGLRNLLKQVSEQAGLRASDVARPSNRPPVIHARQAFMYQARLAGYSTPQIGVVLGVNHSTVSYGSERHAERSGLPIIPPPRPYRGNGKANLMHRLYAAPKPLQLIEIGGAGGANLVAQIRLEHGANAIMSKQGVGYWLSGEGRALCVRLYAEQVAA